jgi:hypothetical protein
MGKITTLLSRGSTHCHRIAFELLLTNEQMGICVSSLTLACDSQDGVVGEESFAHSYSVNDSCEIGHFRPS